MWTCKQCKTDFRFSQVKPAIDWDGLHFHCPKCKHRNVLANVARPGRTLVLTQLDA